MKERRVDEGECDKGAARHKSRAKRRRDAGKVRGSRGGSATKARELPQDLKNRAKRAPAKALSKDGRFNAA